MMEPGGAEGGRSQDGADRSTEMEPGDPLAWAVMENRRHKAHPHSGVVSDEVPNGLK